jgi:cephalosporin hydroxylase
MTFPIGSYIVDRNQPALGAEEEELLRRFHDLYYRRWQAGADTLNLSWLGHEVVKAPQDLWIYQELLVRTRPDVIVETGTYKGGSALFLATILDHIGQGRVVTIDIEPWPGRPEHPRITYITGSSTDPAVVADITRLAHGRVMVILDSDHHVDHVYAELVAYSPLVRVGDYLIVEDTNINGHPTRADFGPGPMEALEKFLAGSDEFVIDAQCERFLLTMQPRGFLRRRSA